jgi:hypothetical protein
MIVVGATLMLALAGAMGPLPSPPPHAAICAIMAQQEKRMHALIRARTVDSTILVMNIMSFLCTQRCH